MSVITFESEAYKAIESMFTTTLAKVGAIEGAIKTAGDDRVMNLKEATQYMSLGKSWLLQNKADIGFIQIGCGPVYFRKSQIDEFLAKHTHQSKFKK